MQKLKSQKGFTLIELLIVVAILGILAAVVIPNVGRFLGRGEDEARRAEFHDIGTAVTALMVENGLSTIPIPYATNDAPCTTGTQDLTKYPDATSTLASKEAQLSPAVAFAVGDKLGYTLYAHDMTGGGVAGPDVNYVNFNKSKYCYTADLNGTVHQWDTAGVEQLD